MSNVTEIFRLFFFAGWRRQALIMLAMLLGVAAENVSIASLWPIIGIMSGDTSVVNSPPARLVTDGLAVLGVPPDLGPLLLFLCTAITLKFILSTGGLIFVGKEVARMTT